MKAKAPILPPKIPQPLKPREPVPTLLKAIEGARNLAADPGPTDPEVEPARAKLRRVHRDLKELRKSPPDDIKDEVWVRSLMKTLDQTLDIYFERVEGKP